MLLWRLTRRPYADLSGRGGELADGRWHTRGRPVVYCAAGAALAVLEVRVRLDVPLDLLPDDYVLIRIDAPDDLAVRTIGPSDLPRGWRSREDRCRPIGDAWLEEGLTVLLSVPSAIVEVERNVLLNPRHSVAGYFIVHQMAGVAPSHGPDQEAYCARRWSAISCLIAKEVARDSLYAGEDWRLGTSVLDRFKWGRNSQ